MDDSSQSNHSHLDPALMRMLDACRPGSDDAERLDDPVRRTLMADPRYAEWHRRNQAFDLAVSLAYRKVDVPVDLEAKLQAALAESDREEAAAAAMSPTVAEGTTRRRWLLGATSALTATAAGLALAAWWRGLERDTLTTEELLHEALSAFRHDGDRTSATPVSVIEPPEEFPLSLHVVPEAEPRWRSMTLPLVGRNGVQYELTSLAAPRAVLYVVAVRGRGTPALPPLPSNSVPAPSTTGGCSLAAWCEDDRLFVLVVDGDERRFRRFVERPRAVA